MTDIQIFNEDDEPPQQSTRGRPTIVKNGARACSDCKAVKLVDQFSIRSVAGRPYLMSICLDCKTQRDWAYRMRKKLLDKARGA